MKKTYKISALLATMTLVLACEKYELPEVAAPEAGTADFSKVIVVGGNVASGFMNGALYFDGQNQSYPAIIASQMGQAGGGDFAQPSVGSTSVNGCYNPTGGCTLGRLYLKLVNGSPLPTPKSSGELAVFAPYSGDNNNFSVPSLTIQTALIPQTGGPANANPYYNPYYARFASAPGTSTVIGDAAAEMADGGTFFIMDLGTNDMLGYALGGASNSALLTSKAAFSAAYNAALNALFTANPEAKGVLANIPDIADLPYFTSVAYNPVPLDAGTASLLSGANGFGGYNQALDGLVGFKALFGISDALAAEITSRKVSFTASKTNKILITDESLTDLGPYFDALANANVINGAQRAALEPYRQVRHTKSTDLVVLPAASVLGTLIGGNPTAINGVSLPLGYGEAGTSDKYIITPAELTEIQTRTAEFNAIIADAVSARTTGLNTTNEVANLTLADVYKNVKDARNGRAVIKGSTITASIAPPFGGFSLDGVHPNARGNGWLANIFISSINKTFKSSIPLCDPNSLNGNEFPIP